MIANIQILRGFAAYLVVCHHILFFGRNIYPIEGVALGASGVDIFFIISGFIMVYTTEKSGPSVLGFFQNRTLRIVPLYWLITILTAGLVVIGFAPLGLTDLNALDLLTSLLFLPRLHEGVIGEPIVFVGWTLNYEMFFYLLFGLSLLLKDRSASLIALGALFLALCVAGSNFPSDASIIGYYANPIILEFIVGCAFGAIYLHLPERRWKTLAPFGAPLAAIGIITLLVSGIYLAEIMPSIPGRRLLVFGIPAAMIVAGMLILERSGLRITKRFLLMQGAASYSIYLIHPLVLQVLFKVAGKVAPAGGALSMSLLFPAALLAVAAVGTAMHYFIERPVAQFLSGRGHLKAA
jgi:exopolysaccharide production protein ExoZ